MKRRVLLSLPILFAVVFASGTPAEAAKQYRADRYDVALSLQPDGSMQVTETIRFVFGPDSFSYVFREIPTRRTDGIEVVAVSIDGQPLSPGKQAGQYEVKRADNGRRRIVWHFADTTGVTRTFQITYLVKGLVELTDSADVASWRVLPADHDYVIGCAGLTLRYPPSASLLEAPTLDPVPTRTTAEGSMLGYELCPVGRDDSWVVSASFAPRSLASEPPAWQVRSARQSTYLPAFLGVAGFLLMAGVLGFVVFGLNHRSSVHADAHARLTDPPEDLPAGLAVALAREGQVQGSAAFATLLDLASRGAIRIDEVASHSRFRKHEFQVVPGEASRASAAHERALMDLLFTSKTGSRSSVKLSDLAKILQSPGRWKRFSNAIRNDLRASGLVDPAREITRGATNRLALGILVAGIVGFAVTIPFVNTYGPASLLVPGAVMAVALAGFITAGTLPILTDDGLRRAGLWAAHGRQLKTLSKDPGGASDAEAFGRMLPLAAGFGVAVVLAKSLEKRGMTAGAPWLSALGGADHAGGHMGVTIAMLSAGHTASAQSGGAHGAGAGAAGGGASGAG